MIKYLTLALLLVAGPAAAQARDPDAANISARIQLAAVNAPGDAVSDAALAREVEMHRDYATPHDIDTALLQSMEAAHATLQARTDARMRKEPVLLATFSGCFWRKEVPADCKGAREDLEKLAGDNAYHHFVLMADAGSRGDEAAFARHALNVLAAPEYRPDFQQVFASLHDRYRHVPDALWTQEENKYGASAPAIRAMAIAAAVALPAYQQFTGACRGSDGDRRELCLQVARRMVGDSPVLLDRMVGRGLLEKMGTAADQAQALAWKREESWLVQGIHGFEDELDASQINTYFDLFVEQGEIAAMRYASQARGRPPEPPVGWQP